MWSLKLSKLFPTLLFLEARKINKIILLCHGQNYLVEEYLVQIWHLMKLATVCKGSCDESLSHEVEF